MDGRVRELTNNAKAVGVGAAAISAFCFGGSGPFAKPLIAAGLSSVEVAWLRLAGGALLMLPFALRHTAVLRQAPKLLIAFEDWVDLAWTGALLITFGVLGLNILARTVLHRGR